MPERPEDFEDAWARIVADLTSEGNLADDPRTPSVDPPAQAEDAGTAGLHALFEPLRRANAQPEPAADDPDPGAFVDNWQDEGHYAPPPPPALPEGTPVKRLAWVGLLGGPATLALIAVTGWDAPPVVGIGAGLATLAGFVTLVWHLPESREDGWDDGARV